MRRFNALYMGMNISSVAITNEIITGPSILGVPLIIKVHNTAQSSIIHTICELVRGFLCLGIILIV